MTYAQIFDYCGSREKVTIYTSVQEHETIRAWLKAKGVKAKCTVPYEETGTVSFKLIDPPFSLVGALANKPTTKFIAAPL